MDKGLLITLCVIGAIGALAGYHQLTKSSPTGYETTGGTRHHRKKGTRRSRK